jgi:hypothetical protein
MTPSNLINCEPEQILPDLEHICENSSNIQLSVNSQGGSVKKQLQTRYRYGDSKVIKFDVLCILRMIFW